MPESSQQSQRNDLQRMKVLVLIEILYMQKFKNIIGLVVFKMRILWTPSYVTSNSHPFEPVFWDIS